MKWYMFHQNNSGGSFVGPELIGVEAPDIETACGIAQRHGVYFNGVADGYDCDCCGDRWYRPWNDQGDDEPNDYGNAIGSVKNIYSISRPTLLVPFQGEPTKLGDWSHTDKTK